MKRNRIIAFALIVLALVTFASCSVFGEGENAYEQTKPFAAIETALKKVDESQSAQFAQTVKNGDLLLSSCSQNFTKGSDGWTYEKTETTLSDDAYAEDKYVVESSTGTSDAAPYLKIDRDAIEKIDKEENDGQTLYSIKIYARKTKSFLGLSEEEVAKVTDLEVTVAVQSDKVVKTEIGYKVSGKQVKQTLTYVY